jgi:hypothetical protein
MIRAQISLCPWQTQSLKYLLSFCLLFYIILYKETNEPAANRASQPPQVPPYLILISSPSSPRLVRVKLWWRRKPSLYPGFFSTQTPPKVGKPTTNICPTCSKSTDSKTNHYQIFISRKLSFLYHLVAHPSLLTKKIKIFSQEAKSWILKQKKPGKSIIISYCSCWGVVVGKAGKKLRHSRRQNFFHTLAPVFWLFQKQ